MTVIRQGAQQAGTVFIQHNHLNGEFDLYGPAPQIYFAPDADRAFERVLSNVNAQAIDKYMESQINFDPDLWLIETESGTGEISLNIISE